MVEGTTRSGFAFKLEDDAFDDYDVMMDLAAADKGNSFALFSAAEKLLGEEQVASLKEHCKKENGRVSAMKMTECIGDIFQSCKRGKNS